MQGKPRSGWHWEPTLGAARSAPLACGVAGGRGGRQKSATNTADKKFALLAWSNSAKNKQAELQSECGNKQLVLAPCACLAMSPA